MPPPDTSTATPLPEAEWTELSLPEFEPAVLFYRPQAPVFIVTHGAGGEAEWHCRHYHALLAGRVTLLCPRGKRRHARDPAQGFYYPDHLALRREVLALVERFEAITSKGGAQRPYVYAGYSQGATMGALAFATEGRLFSHLLLVEGGYADWSTAQITHFAASGGQAVLLVCGTEACHQQARGAVNRLLSSGIRARALWAKGAGHRPDGAVGEALASGLAQLFDDDPRWLGNSADTNHHSAPRAE